MEKYKRIILMLLDYGTMQNHKAARWVLINEYGEFMGFANGM